MSPHPAVAAMRTLSWHAGQAAALDRALRGLVADGLPGRLIDSQRAAVHDQVSKADAAYAHLRQCLLGA